MCCLFCVACTGLFVYFQFKIPHYKYCLQVGEEKLVLDIGQAALRRPDSKPYAHDVLLAMALAEVSTIQRIKKHSCLVQSTLFFMSLVVLNNSMHFPVVLYCKS
jgi:hypothetical protein